jgi:hypothetical protein
VKAFDSVDHGIAVDKLEFRGISGKLLWYKIISKFDTKKYTLIQLMHMIMFLLDLKSYKLGSSGFELGFIISSYLF